MPHFLALEAAIVERLRNRLPADVHVLTRAELAAVAEGNQPVPAVHVIYNGYRVAERRPDGTAARITQTWLVTVAVRNVRTQLTGEAAREDAGELASAVLAALMGWKPTTEGNSAPAQLVEAPAPAYAAGFYYLPLAFELETVVKST